jgi:type IV pilus assembly protein PilQ
MKKYSILLMAFLLSSIQPFAHAQDTDLSEVDRILSEIETETMEPETMEPPEEAAETDESKGSPENGVVSDTETVTEDPVMEDPETEPSAPTRTDPSSIPAITLEEAIDVDGLEITGGEDINRGLITLVYKEVKLADMVRIFAQTSGANIIIPEGLDEPVSGNLNDVYWREALDVILSDKGYALVERKSGIFTINSVDDMALEPLTTESIDLQYITSEAALPAVQSMIVTSNAKVTPIPQTNVLIVSETPQRLQEIKRVLQIVDRPRRQVFIEAKFVELNDSAIKDLGINWEVLQNYRIGVQQGPDGLVQYSRTDSRMSQDAQALVTGRSSGSARISDPLNPDDESRANFSNNSQFDALVQGKNFDSFDSEAGTIATIPSMKQDVIRSAVLSASEFAITLSALQQLDGVRIVSNPKMLVANGQTARIHVGRSEPNIRAIPQGENANTFAYVLDGYIETGVKLEVTPTISTDRNITVKIIPELSSIFGQKIVGEAGTSFPILDVRTIDTEFAVESGKTVAIGGLTRGRDSEVVKKIPLLGDLPIIGRYLFSHTRTEQVQEEVMIFVSVDTVETDHLTDRQGIPEQGKLIHTWLDHQKIEREAKAAGIVLED